MILLRSVLNAVAIKANSKTSIKFCSANILENITMLLHSIISLPKTASLSLSLNSVSPGRCGSLLQVFRRHACNRILAKIFSLELSSFACATLGQPIGILKQSFRTKLKISF